MAKRLFSIEPPPPKSHDDRRVAGTHSAGLNPDFRCLSNTSASPFKNCRPISVELRLLPNLQHLGFLFPTLHHPSLFSIHLHNYPLGQIMMSFAQVAKRQATQGLRQQVLTQRGQWYDN